MGGLFEGKIHTHYRGGHLKAENQLRLDSDPLPCPKMGKITLPPLMFWACPVAPFSLRESDSEGDAADSLKKLTEGAKSPPPFFQKSEVSYFQRHPLKMFNT